MDFDTLNSGLMRGNRTRTTITWSTVLIRKVIILKVELGWKPYLKVGFTLSIACFIFSKIFSRLIGLI